MRSVEIFSPIDKGRGFVVVCEMIDWECVGVGVREFVG